jgi:hypothetical protein
MKPLCPPTNKAALISKERGAEAPRQCLATIPALVSFDGDVALGVVCET